MAARRPPDAATATPVTVVTPDAPDAVIAVRAGDGAWTTASGADTPITFEAIDRYTVAVGCPTLDQAPQFYPEYVLWRPPRGAAAYALRSTGRTIFVSPGVLDDDDALPIPGLATIPGWPFTDVAPTWSASAILGTAGIEDAIRLVPRDDTDYVTMR